MRTSTVEKGRRALTVVAIDEHWAVRRGVELILARVGHQVRVTAGDPLATPELLRRTRPDVVLLEISLASSDALELVRELCRNDRGERLLIYTGFPRDQRLSEAIALGIGGVALKDEPPRKLVEAIEAVAAGRLSFHPRVSGRSSRSGPDVPFLSAREREVFAYVARGFDGNRIAATLGLSPETVRTHVRNGMCHLGARTRVHAVALGLRHGEISV